MHSEEFVPNERLRRARTLKGWSQAELAEQVGTSFEMVSRWERGITVPSPHYRKRLCTVIGQTAEELGLVRDLKNPFTPPSSPFVLLASSHADGEKAIVSHLKTALEERGITLWSSRQHGKQRNGNAQATLHEVIHAAHAILVVISPQARASRHMREALEMARRYQRLVCGVWIEGEHWQHCLPEGHVELAALIDARERDTPAMLEETAIALEQVRLASPNGTEAAQSSIPDTPTEGVPFANLPTGMHLSTNSPKPGCGDIACTSSLPGTNQFSQTHRSHPTTARNTAYPWQSNEPLGHQGGSARWVSDPGDRRRHLGQPQPAHALWCVWQA
jgi:transcriptional regulator with XRE-family HTH domain